MFQSRTLRRLPPEARKLARAYNDMERGLKRMKAAVHLIAEMEWFYEGSKNRPKQKFSLPACSDHQTYVFDCDGCRKAVHEANVVNQRGGIPPSRQEHPDLHPLGADPPDWERG